MFGLSEFIKVADKKFLGMEAIFFNKMEKLILLADNPPPISRKLKTSKDNFFVLKNETFFISSFGLGTGSSFVSGSETSPNLFEKFL